MAAYGRFLDHDGDGAATRADVEQWLRGCVGLHDAMHAPRAVLGSAAVEAEQAAARPAYANNGWTQWCATCLCFGGAQPSTRSLL